MTITEPGSAKDTEAPDTDAPPIPSATPGRRPSPAALAKPKPGAARPGPQPAAPAHLHLSAAWIPADAAAVDGWGRLLAVARFGCPTVVASSEVLVRTANSQEVRAWEEAGSARVHGAFCESIS